jgi:hypothetical protein
MRQILLCLILLMIGLGTKAQLTNYVPNSGFEEFVNCPWFTNGLSSLTYITATHWYNPTSNSPDYFNYCNNLINMEVGVPKNIFGIQNAHTGEAYAGFIYWAKNMEDLMEITLENILLLN